MQYPILWMRFPFSCFVIVFSDICHQIMRYGASHQYVIYVSRNSARKCNPMIIRPLTVFERENVRSFYLSLSADDRRRRFCCSLSDATISLYVDRLDFIRDTTLGAFDERAQLVGLAELVRGANESEMAFSVRPDRRGQKIGTRLIARLLTRARMCGVRNVFVMFLPDNTPMRKMALRAGMSVRTADGESHAARPLPPASAQELTRWLMEECVAHNAYFSTLGMAKWGSLMNRPAGATSERDKVPAPAA
jgi:GNAT superfamily N-acetyltransferase